MIKYNINDFKGGWFIGDFEPTLVKTKDFEVSIKYYKAGEIDQNHVHKQATEYTLIIKGKVTINDELFVEKDLILIEKGESALFKTLEETITLVVKIPSVKNDKFLI